MSSRETGDRGPGTVGSARRSPADIPGPPSAHTASAASKVQPGTKTASRRSVRRSVSLSRLKLQSRVARQRLLAGQGGAAPAGQQTEAIVQPCRDLLNV